MQTERLLEKVLVAMSGGVDSAVAALLMVRGGKTCAGAMMKLLPASENNPQSNPTGPSGTDTPQTHRSSPETAGPLFGIDSGCCSLEDVEAARSAAYKIGIPFHVFNFSEDFRRQVVDRFCADYLQGRTPNPCLLCNHHLKFERLLRRARELEYDGVATGHYARIEQSNGRYRLRRAVDLDKDQTYFLYKMTQEQLASTIFPLGCLKKSEVRDIARSAGLKNAERAESQDICFVPDGDVGAFVQSYQRSAAKTMQTDGEIVDMEGRVLGKHCGIENFTIGQRRGLGVSSAARQYVVAIDAASRRVVLGPDNALFESSLVAREVNVIEQLCEKPLKTLVKIRYRAAAAPATAWLENGLLHVEFDTPQRAVTPGQAAVVYDEAGDFVLGGGEIGCRK